MDSNSIEKLMDGVCEVVEEIRTTLPPDGDFMPVVHVFDDESRMTVVGLDTQLLSTSFGKQFLFEGLLCPMVDRLGGRQVVCVMTAWMLAMNGEDAEEKMREAMESGLENHPEHVECVIVNGIDPLHTHIRTAQITRHENAPPTLGEWDIWPSGENIVLEGRMIDPLQAALRDSSGVPDKDFLAKIEAMQGE